MRGFHSFHLHKIRLFSLLLLPSSIISVPFFPFDPTFLHNYGLVNYANLAAKAGYQPQYPKLQTVPQNFLDVQQDLFSTPSANEVCLTDQCIITASDLIQQMDRSLDPCDDFYQFACGNYIANTILPEHKTKLSKFSSLGDKLNEKLKKVFEASSDKSDVNEPKIFKGVRNYFASCMDTESIEVSSVGDLKNILSNLGGWPVVEGDGWSGDDFKWWELSIKSAKEGFSSKTILGIGFTFDPKDSERRIMEVDQFTPGLEREYLIKGFDDKDVQAYYKLMVNMAVMLGAEEELAKKEMEDALKLELKLAEFALSREDRRNETALYHPMPLTDIQNLYPEIPLLDYINGINIYEEGFVTEDEVINVPVPDYVTKVREHLAKVPDRVLANYIIWRNVKEVISLLNAEALQHDLEYDKVLTGKSQDLPRWEKCTKSVSGLGDPKDLYFLEGSLSNAVGSLYARNYFKLEAKNKVDEMVELIRAEFSKMLDELDWMDSETKEKAHSKLDKMASYMAYPKELLDNDLLNEYYAGLDLKADSYLKNYLRLKLFIDQYYAKEFRNKVDKKDWRTHGGAAIVNAFYSAEDNSISFPAGILGGVFFDPDRPAYMNYGAIGLVIGHEITHGFDDQGSQRDGDGTLVDWWQPETKEKYLEKAQCIIDQYGNYTIDIDGETYNVNGINSQGENIADNGGLKESLRAYDHHVATHGPEPVLPGLGYTHRQLFWLSGASIWCSVIRPSKLKQQVLTDPHSPPAPRVNLPLMNIPEFAKDWKCPSGSTMNPIKKCSVW